MSTYLLVHGAWHSGQLLGAGGPVAGGGRTSGGRALADRLRRQGAAARPRGGAGHARRRHRRADHRGRPHRRGARGTQLCRAGHLVRGQPDPGADRPVGLPRRDGPGGRRERGRRHAHEPGPDRPRRGSGSGWRVPPLPEGPPPLGLFGVTDPSDVAWLRTMLSDQPVRCLQQPVHLDNPAVRRDSADAHPLRRRRAGGVVRRPVPELQPNGTPAQVWELPTGHDCMITMPGELAELLLKLG